MEILIIFFVLALLVYFIWKKPTKAKNVTPLSSEQKKLLTLHVSFYNQLNEEEKKQFEQRVSRFIHTTKITGIETNIDDLDRVLVGASAIIPVFAFPNWEYINLKEVLLYPSGFNEKFQTGKGGLIQGMVGTGYMEGKMILSKPALHTGFKNARDKKNVGIHEFTHLIDKADGETDGIPTMLLDKQFALPWFDLVQKEMDNIHLFKSDINPYGGVSKTEFFAVLSEYFFERPKLLKSKHPDLYHYLEMLFTVDLSEKYKGTVGIKEIGRNDPCICGSGEKYKHCCGS